MFARPFGKTYFTFIRLDFLLKRISPHFLKHVKEWILLQDPSEKHSIELRENLVKMGLGLGEAYSIALAKEMGTVFLANDKQAIEVAREYGVETRWFTEILHDALKRKCIRSIDEYAQVLDACINHGLYVSKKQREKAIEIAKKIT